MSATTDTVDRPAIGREFFTPREVSALTGTTERHVINLTKRGTLASVWFGHGTLI